MEVTAPFLSSALGGQFHAPAALPPRTEKATFGRRDDRLPGIEPNFSAVQTVAR
jgi:hypothetical protein